MRHKETCLRIDNTFGTPGKFRRRVFLLATTAFCLTTPVVGLAQQTAAPGLDDFLVLSSVLTGIDLRTERELGQLYLDNLLAQPDNANTLTELWQRGGFASATPPRTHADLQQRGIYTQSSLQLLADAITLQWYSGIYTATDGSTRVATYTSALAWRALPYRPAGPSTCGGAFGHWASAPVEV